MTMHLEVAVNDAVQNAVDQVPLFAALTPAQRARLTRAAGGKAVARDAPVWSEGSPADDFLIVIKGRVKLVKRSSHGTETILNIVNRHELLCVKPLRAACSYCCTALGLEDGTEVLIVPRQVMLELVDACPPLARELLHQLADRCHGMCDRVEELGSGKAEQRIASLLMRLADRFGVPSTQGLRIPVPLLRQDIAAMCGVAQETAIRILSAWRKRGWMRDGARGLVILEPLALRALVQGDRPVPQLPRSPAAVRTLKIDHD